jgi:hypothetical protein
VTFVFAVFNTCVMFVALRLIGFDQLFGLFVQSERSSLLHEMVSWKLRDMGTDDRWFVKLGESREWYAS